MPDSSEIAAVKASLRGALASADALAALRDRVEALDGNAEIPSADLDDLARLAAANATAAAALRGLVETARKKRGTPNAER